jgi:type IV pilus assembly protein PilQ
MKRVFVTTIAILFLMLASFVSRLSAEEQPPLAAKQDVNISMDFKDASLKDILKVFSIQAGMNFIASEAVKDRAITLYLDKVPLELAMDKIFSANNLSYELDQKANIFVVKEWGKMETETVTKVFFLKNASVSVSALKDELAKGLGAVAKGEGGITDAVKKLLSSVGSLVEDFRTNSIIVTDTPMKMKVISQVIESLDVAVPQIMLEVEMLDVSKDAVDKLGFQFGDTPFQAVITGATTALGFPYADWSKTFRNLTDAAIGGAGEYNSTGTLSINPNPYTMQLDFMRTRTDTKYLARPKLLTLNNETAEISITKDEIVGREDTTTFNAGVPTTTSVYSRSTDLSLTKEGTGIFLRVTPQINLDANEITLVINPKSSVSNISSLSSDANPQSDVEVRSTKSIVKIKDGETIILGGLIHQDKSIVNKRVPILGDLPMVGALFRHKNQTVGIERELIIFITPRIIRDKVDVKLAQIQNIQLPIREQGLVVGSNRDYIIASNMNKFDKGVNGKR